MKKAEKRLLWFGFMAFAATLLFSFLPTRFHIFNYDFREVDFLSDIKTSNPSTPLGKITHAAPLDTTKFDFTTYKDIINYQPANNQPVEKFIKALRDLMNGKRKLVRIAYLGDSFIEGDLITMDLRRMLQMRFGGSGVGFVPITSISAGFRQTISHSFTSNWNDYSFKSPGDRSRVFISGHNFSTNGGASVSYRSTKDSLLNHFDKVFALYKSSKGVTVSINNSPLTFPASAVVAKKLVATQVQSLSASFASGNNIYYGFSFEPDTGIVVDNFSFRGISGVEFKQLAPDFLSQINDVQLYDLIVFQYGPNLLFKPGADDFTYYSKPMTTAIELFRNGFPKSDILMVSTGDKAFRYNGVYKTAKGVLPLLYTQQQIAASTGINFWNLYLNMGGENSMIEWVEGEKKMANKDYTHVNWQGGKKIAELIYNTLLHAYQTNK